MMVVLVSAVVPVRLVDRPRTVHAAPKKGSIFTH